MAAYVEDRKTSILPPPDEDKIKDVAEAEDAKMSANSNNATNSSPPAPAHRASTTERVIKSESN